MVQKNYSYENNKLVLSDISDCNDYLPIGLR